MRLSSAVTDSSRAPPYIKDMATHPINLGLRFLLELCALAATATYGWTQFDGALRWILALAGPLLFMVLWATFAVPDDPSRSGAAPVPVPGALRLALEFALLGFAAWALHVAGYTRPSLVYATCLTLHYATSWDRVIWLLKQ